MRYLCTPGVAVMVFAAVTSVAARQSSHDSLTTKEIMATMTVPGSDAIFAAASDNPSWDAVRKGAVLVEESGQLLMTGARVRDREGWLQNARELVARAGAARRIADTTKNADALIEASDRLYETCKACHDRYMAAN
jgi:hypothetical protein